MSENFRRTDPRYQKQLDVELVAGGQSQQLKSRDLSLGGIFITTFEPLRVQTVVQVRFRIPTQAELMEVGGEVRWVVKPQTAGEPAGMGIRFQGLRAREVWALNRFFQE